MIVIVQPLSISEATFGKSGLWRAAGTLMI